MSEWSLTNIFESLHADIHTQLTSARKSFAHPGTKGDGSENAWLELLRTYLPKRYQADKAHVVDSNGNFSEQMDIVIFDRQYSPFVFDFQGQIIVPAESVYAVFESKQTVNSENIQYAKKKISSVRKLHRTSLPIPFANGVYPPKPLFPIIGGLLALDCDWKPAMGETLVRHLSESTTHGAIDIGCVAAHGYYYFDKEKRDFEILNSNKAATAFLLKLIAELQFSGTVPMIDVLSYSKWMSS
ncbi:hypothetical protein QGM61_06470 [Pseudohongiella sp. SYSU M77423]|uniref:DUF6602 domain-containing protein n=1 Tax=Pseudohongiella sp. SYSU M77423 TaxID=3042312 RepID=UPI00248030DF|nr:DUF6602 domain-containing protein [Pseudohongiella sp. SYSU M77423]MDH7943459.1 hypothetical protein [Pseudohongiella sp. SYSU M77423]